MKIKIISIIGGFAILAGVVFVFAQKGEIVTVERLNQSGKEFEEVENKNETALMKELISEEEIEKEEVPKPDEIDKTSDDTSKEEGFVSEKETKDEKTEEELKIINKKVDWGFASSESRKIDTIILHTSYNILGGDQYSTEKVIEEYCQYEVAPHYLIDRKGLIFRLVDDENIAYHAGESRVPDGRTGVNNFSLGIEVINSEKDKFTASQYEAINLLLKDLKRKYEIKYVLGHNDIAPGRKTDPWNIDWNKVNK